MPLAKSEAVSLLNSAFRCVAKQWLGCATTHESNDNEDLTSLKLSGDFERTASAKGQGIVLG